MMMEEVMELDELVDRCLAEHLETIDLLRADLSIAVVEVGRTLAEGLAAGGTVFWCGNGGSASDSQHIAAELVGRFRESRRPLRSISLNTDTSVLTCIGNDFGYDDVFSRQVEALGRSGDILVGISTSGRSPNVNGAFRAASRLGVTTIGLLGKGGGEAVDIVDHAVVVPSASTARIQESHILIGHMFCEIIEQELGLE